MLSHVRFAWVARLVADALAPGRASLDDHRMLSRDGLVLGCLAAVWDLACGDHGRSAPMLNGPRGGGVTHASLGRVWLVAHSREGGRSSREMRVVTVVACLPKLGTSLVEQVCIAVRRSRKAELEDESKQLAKDSEVEIEP